MTHRGWLEKLLGDRSRKSFAESVHARVEPEYAKRVCQAGALSNRMGKTDKGESGPQWWNDHPPFVTAMAEELHVDVSEVRAWYRAAGASGSSTWRPGEITSISRFDLREPPPGLWPDWVDAWVTAIERNESPTQAAWFAVEPGLSRTWLREWLEARRWRIIKARSPLEAAKKLRQGQRGLVFLTDPQHQLEQAAPQLKPRSALLVAAQHPLLPSGDDRIERAGSWRGPPPQWNGWSLLDSTSRDNQRTEEIIEWFQQRAVPDRRADLTALDARLAKLENRPLPGELLLLLDTIADEDPIAALCDRHPGLELEALRAMEAEALRRGYGSSRPLDCWEGLVPVARDAEATLAELRRAIKARNPALALSLAEQGARALVEALRERGLLQPSPQKDDTWILWPRWFGQGLRDGAATALLGANDAIGSLLLADEATASSAREQLASHCVQGNGEALRSLLQQRGVGDAAVATVEGVTLAVGHHLLDGGEVSVELAAEIMATLQQTRASACGGRLLAHGDGPFIEAAMIMAEWALAWRAGAQAPSVGPWNAEIPVEDLTTDLETMGRSLHAWVDTAWPPRNSWQSHTIPDLDPTTARALAQRMVRLGTLSYQARGLLPVLNDEERAMWPFQAPAALIAVCMDETAAPGRPAVEIFQERVPDEAREPMSRALTEQRQGTAIQSGEEFLWRFQAEIAFSLAKDEPEAKTRHRFLSACSKAAYHLFPLLREEVLRAGGSLHDVVRWLWVTWNEPGNYASDLPPVQLLKDQRIEDARLVWHHAPAEIRREIWQSASEKDALWEVLDHAGWRAWARQCFERSKGWERIPREVLLERLGEELPSAAYTSAWTLAAEPTCDWTVRRLTDLGPSDASLRIALEAAPPAWVPALIERAGPQSLPAWWLQRVVTQRASGWRKAWSLLASAEASTEER